MTKWISSAVMLCVFALVPAAAQVDPGSVRVRKPNQCLSDAELKINKDLKALNRPTIGADPSWIFDPDYLLGQRTFEWDVPETPLGSGGKITGAYTFKRIEDCFYEGTIDAKSPDGPYQGKVLIVYSPEYRYMTWLETDSRGISMLKAGRVAGDLGGYFTHHWDVPAFTHKGKVVRLAGTYFFSSPTSFRFRPRISIDGDEYTNYGNPWFIREDRTPTPPKP